MMSLLWVLDMLAFLPPKDYKRQEKKCWSWRPGIALEDGYIPIPFPMDPILTLVHSGSGQGRIICMHY